VAGKDQHPDGRTRSTSASNVVHLRPRPWLESEDELVPIDGAGQESGANGVPTSRNDGSVESTAASRRGHASTWLGPDEETVPIVLEPTTKHETGADAKSQAASWAASDFWGEDAANVHDTLEAPVPAQPSSTTAAPAYRRPATSHRLLRAPALIAITIAAVAVIAAVVSGFGSAPAAPRHPAPASPLHVSAAGRSMSAVNTAAVARPRTPRPVSPHRSRRHIRSGARVRLPSTSRSAHASTRRHHPAAPAAAATRYIAPAPVSTPAATTYRTETPTQATSASSPGPAGPTGTGSLIGPGTSPSG
jgi:hypothetical protein